MHAERPIARAECGQIRGLLANLTQWPAEARALEQSRSAGICCDD
jgi:hypothetical protein